ncbi:hypothetical protein M0813_27490 [Anaeramoeba flamelloides]|uniref:Uncharacterized protein n=1 Tax=Anaeramoeba flamelloides TaxID=1746091 RepID=A0ABQ8XWN6_9EUKA|nr:hypothetical protein M0813_27490 [Anaeramoeba flamelloides]
MIQNFDEQNTNVTNSQNEILLDCFKLQQQFGLFLHTNYHNNNFQINQAISRFLSEKIDPNIRSKMKKQLHIVAQVFLQNGFVIPNDSLKGKEKTCYLCENLKQVFVKIQKSPNFPHAQKHDIKKNKPPCKNTREKITNETGYARQRICTVLSIFKGLGIVKEGTKKNRVLELNKRQKESFFSVQDLSKKVIDLRNRRRTLFEKMKHLVGELETKIDKEDQNEIKCYGWFDRYTQNYFSRKEKYITNIEDSICHTSKSPLLKTYKTSLPFPKIRSYLGFCSSLNCSRFSQNYQSSTIRIPVKILENKRSNNSGDKKKKILVIKTRKRISNSSKSEDKKKKQIKPQMERDNGLLILKNTDQKSENDDIIHAAHLILSIAPSRRKSPQFQTETETQTQIQIQTQTQTETETHPKKQQEPSTNSKDSKLQNTQRGSEENYFINTFTEPVFLKHQIRDSKQLINPQQLNNTNLNHSLTASVPQFSSFGINSTISKKQNNLNLSTLKMLDINQLIQQFNSETSVNK